METLKTQLVAAIDIGTTYSGYAYSFRTSPRDIKTCDFTTTNNNHPASFKIPSSVLLNKDKKFVAFGQDAEERFVELWDSGDTTHMLFRHFKNFLHNDPTLTKNTKVKDISGQYEFRVLNLYVMAVNYLKNHMMKSLNRFKVTYSENDVHFVLTVPGIWNNRAKVFMRQVAMKSCIKPERVTLALESEAASIWCQECPDGPSVKKNGTKYVMADLGGGIADMSVHSSVGDGSVFSLYSPCGGDWGGTSVDNCFTQYLGLAFGSEAVNHFRSQHVGDYFKMMLDFEDKKRNLNSKTLNGCMSVFIPKSLLDLAISSRDFQNLETLTSSVARATSDKLQLKGDKLVIDGELSTSMLDYMSRSISSQISTLLQQESLKGVQTVIFVGGFASSELVQTILKQNLKDRKLIFPSQSNSFNVKGATLFGHDPQLVRTRIWKLTYGLKVSEPFDETKHKGGETQTINGKKMCTNVFRVLVEGGAKLTAKEQLCIVDKPLTWQQTTQVFEIFSTSMTHDIPTLTSHCSVNHEATFSVPLAEGKVTDNKKFEMITTLGETEMSFKIKFIKGDGPSYTHYLVP